MTALRPIGDIKPERRVSPPHDKPRGLPPLGRGVSPRLRSASGEDRIDIPGVAGARSALIRPASRFDSGARDSRWEDDRQGLMNPATCRSVPAAATASGFVPSRRLAAKTPVLHTGYRRFESCRDDSSPVRRCYRRHASSVGRWSGFEPRADLGGSAMGGWSNGKTPALQAGDRNSIPRPVRCEDGRTVAGYGWPGRPAKAVSPMGMRVRIPHLPLRCPDGGTEVASLSRRGIPASTPDRGRPSDPMRAVRSAGPERQHDTQEAAGSTPASPITVWLTVRKGHPTGDGTRLEGGRAMSLAGSIPAPSAVSVV